MKHRADLRRVKVHRTYTVQELARVTGVHDHTVRAWIKAGLATLCDAHPILVSGREAKRFLSERRRSRKRPCGPDRFYCFRCREPREPAFGVAEFVPLTNTFGNLTALCPECGTLMHKRASAARLDGIGTKMEITFPMGRSRLDESPNPSLNRDFAGE